MARPARALIIACENYRRAEDVAQELKGTLEAAAHFYDWLVTEKKVPVDNIYVCCDDPLVPAHPADHTFGANREKILDAIEALCEKGRGTTGELFVFFSGHGVGWEISPQQRGLDVLLASGYRKRGRSGGECIKLDQLRSEMRNWLGGEDHYYFLDACRTVMKIGEIEPLDLGLILPLALNEDPTTYVLYSTKFGEPAKVNSGFAGALINGLKGTGRAKQNVNGNWWVRFERVQQFVQTQVKGKTDLLKDGTRDGLILTLPAQQASTCTVTVDTALPGDQFTLAVEVRGTDFQRTFEFAGGSFQKDLSPSDSGYQFNLTKGGGSRLVLVDPPPDKFLDLFDPTALRFAEPPPGAAPQGLELEVAPPQAGIEVPKINAPNLAVQVRSVATGAVTKPVDPSAGPKWIPLTPGEYVAEVTERGRVAWTEPITLTSGEQKALDMLRLPESRVQRSIIARIPKRDGLPDASETLGGPLINQDTSVWLSILGGSRVIEEPSTFSKLGPLRLATFDDLVQNDSAIYALAGLEDGSAAQIGIGTDANAEWTAMDAVDDLDGVFQFRRRLQPGPCLVSFAVPDMPPITYASYALPNRVSLMVFVVQRSRQIVARQMLLPVYSLQRFLDPTVRERFRDEKLRLVKYLTIAQELFANRQSLEPGTPEEKETWDSLLYGKWIDPLLGLMAVYDAVRRGRAETARPQLSMAIDNLNRFFGDLPDVAAASQALGLPSTPPSGTPLLMESVQRVPELKRTLPLKADFLDYGSMWTSWWGAVTPPRW